MKIIVAFVLVVGSVTISFSQIRDVRSLPARSKPLVILDGISLPELVKSQKDSTKLVDPLSEIDPNDIDRMDVLKNETAVALYGEQAVNGAVVITTKAYYKKSKKQK